MAKSTADTTIKSIQAGVLSWVIPGAGHFMLGQRGLAIVFFVAVTFPYLTGLALGGVMESVNPRANKWLFMAELGTGGYTTTGFYVSRSIENDILRELGYSRRPDQQREPAEHAAFMEAATEAGYVSYYPVSDVAQIYLAAAGLLNLLVILDAISRAQTGLPTFHRQLPPEPKPEAES